MKNLTKLIKTLPVAELNGVSTEIFALLEKQIGILRELGSTTIVYELDSSDLWVLHSVVCLGAEHPGFQDLTPQSKAAVERFRRFCRRIWMGQGMSPDEARTLDELRVEVNKT